MHVTGSASRLSFGGSALFTLAVQFCPQPSTARNGTMPTGGGSGRDSTGGSSSRPMVLLSKFHAGLRGEYRLGLDAQLRPFFHREVEPWDLVAPTAVTANEWHELHATYDGHTMRLYVDRRLATSAKSAAQFTDQVTPVLLGAEFGRTSIDNHFDGYISEARIWNRALSADEVVHAFAQTQPKSGANLLHRGLLAHWRPLDASLDEPDGRLTVFNLIAARSNSITTMDALLKRNSQVHPLELTLRAGVRAVLVELGSVTARSAQWRRGIQMINRKDEFKHYCYLGTSVALQKSLLQALDLHAHQLIAQRLTELVRAPRSHLADHPARALSCASPVLPEGRPPFTPRPPCCCRSTTPTTTRSRSCRRRPSRNLPTCVAAVPSYTVNGSSTTPFLTCASAMATGASSGASATRSGARWP